MRRSLLALLVVLSCRPSAPQNPAKAPPLPSPESALETLREVGKQRKNLRALGRVTYFGERGRVRLKAVLVAERPGRFRFETISPLEQPIDVMASDGSRLWLLSKEKLSEGPATPENIARLLPLPMHPEEVVDTLLGGVPTSARFEPAAIAWEEPDRERWVLTLSGMSGQTGKIYVDPTRKVVEKMELLEVGGDVRLSVTFEDFEQVGGHAGEIPRDMHIVMPGKNHDVSIKLKEVDINVALSDALFSIAPPPGVIPEKLDSPPVLLPQSSGSGD
jgi:outer membrane lipoprotein-sorting protein